MTTIAAITGIANATGSAHSYALVTATKVSQGTTIHVAKLTKRIGAPLGPGGVVEFGGYGEGQTIALATGQALASLNANRFHRYAGSPGLTGTPTVVLDEHGSTLTADA